MPRVGCLDRTSPHAQGSISQPPDYRPAHRHPASRPRSLHASSPAPANALAGIGRRKARHASRSAKSPEHLVGPSLGQPTSQPVGIARGARPGAERGAHAPPVPPIAPPDPFNQHSPPIIGLRAKLLATPVDTANHEQSHFFGPAHVNTIKSNSKHRETIIFIFNKNGTEYTRHNPKP